MVHKKALLSSKDWVLKQIWMQTLVDNMKNQKQRNSENSPGRLEKQSAIAVYIFSRKPKYEQNISKKLCVYKTVFSPYMTKTMH